MLSIKDSRIRLQILKRIDALENYPEQQGKSLGEELSGYRSVRAVKERYRILYKTEKEKIVVLVVTMGIRKEGDKKDVYAVAQKLSRLGLLDLIKPLLSSSTPDAHKAAESDEQSDTTEEE